MKKSKIILISFLCMPFLCSFSNGKLYIEWHAFRHANKLYDDNGNYTGDIGVDAGGYGHSYIQFRNNTSANVKIGYSYVKPSETLTVGLWGVAETSSGSVAGPNDMPVGVYYNRERYYYNKYERIKDFHYTYKEMDMTKLNIVNDKIIEHAETYNALGYNCATFATEVWNLATGSGHWCGWFRRPQNCIDEIIAHYDDYEDYNLTYTDDYYHFNRSGTKYVY